MTPAEVLQRGASILDAVLKPHGFIFVFKGAGSGSGGPFAWGECVRGSRRLEFHFRYALGCVIYHDGDCSIEHVTYMKALGSSRSAYGGESSDLLEPFRQVAQDIVEFAAEFSSGSATTLRVAAHAGAADAAKAHRQLMASYVGDDRRISEARRSFHQGDYAKARQLLEELIYPELASDIDRAILQMARERI